MRSVKTMLVLAIATAALAAPTMASGSIWTENGSPLVWGDKTPAWSSEGELLSEATAISLSGNYKFSSAVVGGIDCTLSASGTLNPGESGQITSASVSAASCTTSGPLAPCKVESASASVPWNLTATEKSGVKSISASGVSITYKLNPCFKSEVTVTGGFTATPDNSSAIKSLALSGTMKVGTSNVTVSGSQSVTPSGKLGIANDYSGPEIALDGSLGYSNGVEGAVTCPVEGTITLDGGTNEGAITALAWDAKACSLGGPIVTQCESVTSVTSKLLPWPVFDEGTSIRISEFPITLNFSKCGSKSFKGEMTATPDKVAKISSTSLSGSLENASGGKQTWLGSLDWTPAGVYGLQ